MIEVEEKKPNKYLSNRGYIIKKTSLPDKLDYKIRKELTVSPFQIKGYTNAPPTSFKVFLENNSKYYLPRFYAIKNFGEPEIDYLKDHGDNINVDFIGDLREHQIPVIDKMLNVLYTDGGGILNLPTGFGKTCLAINLISKIKKKTLIIVHKNFLMNQWIERINQFMPNCKIGKIQQKIINIDGCDIVLGMLQTLTKNSISQELFESFGFTIIDECHHCAAEVFSRALSKVSTKYMMGLSATLDRKDGLRKVFEWYLGPPAVSIESRKDAGDVNVIIHPIKDSEFQQIFYNNLGKVKLPTLISDVVRSPKRMEIILFWMKLFSEKKRKVLILSERRKHLESIYKSAVEINLECGFYWGNLSNEKLKESEKKQFILGTYHMVSEGFDLSSLDTLILASPKTDVIQASGRILRQGSDRPTIPLIIDIVDQNDYLIKKSKTRQTFYKKNNFELINYDKSIDINHIFNKKK